MLLSAKIYTVFFFNSIYLCEFVSVLPYLLAYLIVHDNFSYIHFFTRMLDVSRLACLFRLSKHIESDINRELSYIVFGVTLLVVWFTAYIQVVENFGYYQGDR
mmetsp:Transcript_18829/g.13646  ORF Transcript_18829/g.13646 Transcript_18829/m.13646 type:complete len:103 (-) Transcript_18829:465-773(-)